MIIIKPTHGNNSNPSGEKLTCKRSQVYWVDDCAVAAIRCKNESGATTINIEIRVCAERIGNSPTNNSFPKESFELIDLVYSFGLGTDGTIDIIELNRLKNMPVVIPNDILLMEGTETVFVMKAGVYKVENKKLHTLVSVEIINF
ncbi:MAG: hypothetical protein COA97_08840 [Flavobacteriales bacterium]|nr:MAG: hypothetical protein COA97_08840 [Flavobacteriales bacterium]